MGARIQEPAVSVARSLVIGELEGTDFITIFLFRQSSRPRSDSDALWQALTLLPQLLLIEIDAGLSLSARLRLCHPPGGVWRRERERASAVTSTTAKVEISSPFGRDGTAVKEVPQPEGLFAALRTDEASAPRSAPTRIKRPVRTG